MVNICPLSHLCSLSLSLALYHEKLNKQTRLENMIIDSSGRRINYPSDTDTDTHTHRHTLTLGYRTGRCSH
jgi:hypothetical protein